MAAAAYPNQDTPYTREGTLAHEVAEKVASGAEVELTDEITTDMVRHAYAYRDYIQELTTTADPELMLERRVDFSPWVPGGFGTADCILIQGKTMDVVDYKYGAGVAVSAERNSQMMLYGLGALNDYGFIFEVETVRLHIFQPRMDNVSTYELPAADLLAWGESIKPTAELAAKGKGKYSAGAHCKFCPHAGKCRELAKVCTTLVEANGAKIKVPTLAPHEVAEILGMEPMISLWLKRVKERAMAEMLDGHEVPGYKVVQGRSSRDWADELAVSAALLAAGYAPEDISKTELLSVAQLEKALGKKKVADLLCVYITQKPGAPTVVPASDKRPAYDRTAEAVADFANN